MPLGSPPPPWLLPAPPAEDGEVVVGVLGVEVVAVVLLLPADADVTTSTSFSLLLDLEEDLDFEESLLDLDLSEPAISEYKKKFILIRHKEIQLTMLGYFQYGLKFFLKNI